MEGGFLLIETSDKESLRNTMLKHEETFKQQVQELHRLYMVQKKLMEKLLDKPIVSNNNGNASASSPKAEVSGPTIFVVQPAQEQQLEFATGRRKGPPVVVNVREGMPSNLGGESENEIELTLSIGCGGGPTEKKKPDEKWLFPHQGQGGEFSCSRQAAASRGASDNKPRGGADIRLDDQGEREDSGAPSSLMLEKDRLQRPTTAAAAATNFLFHALSLRRTWDG